MTVRTATEARRPDSRRASARACGGRPRARRKAARRVLRRVIAVAIGVAFVFPFYWTFVISTDGPGQFDSYPPVLWPQWDWSNWSKAWSLAPWPELFGNTLLIAGCTVILCLVTSTLAGFAFGVLRFPGRRALTLLVLSVLMVPQTVLIIPDYVLANDIHWIDTYWVQIVPWGASVFGVFLVRQFFATMPPEILDAAAVDGASRLRMLWSIGVPAIRPALVIIAINTFTASWNSFLWPEVMTRRESIQPVEVGLAAFASANGTDIPGLAAAATFTTLPLMIFFLVLQRQFIRGALSAAGSIR